MNRLHPLLASTLALASLTACVGGAIDPTDTATPSDTADSATATWDHLVEPPFDLSNIGGGPSERRVAGGALESVPFEATINGQRVRTDYTFGLQRGLISRVGYIEMDPETLQMLHSDSREGRWRWLTATSFEFDSDGLLPRMDCTDVVEPYLLEGEVDLYSTSFECTDDEGTWWAFGATVRRGGED